MCYTLRTLGTGVALQGSVTVSHHGGNGHGCGLPDTLCASALTSDTYVSKSGNPQKPLEGRLHPPTL